MARKFPVASEAESLARSTVETIADLHDLSNAHKTMGELANAAKKSENFAHFLRNSIELFASKGVETDRLSYINRIVQNPASKIYDLDKIEKVGAFYTVGFIKGHSKPSDAAEVANAFTEGSNAKVSDGKTIRHLFNFYSLAHKSHPELKKAISKLEA